MHSGRMINGNSHRSSKLSFICHIHKLNRTTCGLDPFPTKLLMSHLSSIITIILRIVNLCFSSGDFPASCKSAIISPLNKKNRSRF